MGTPKPLEEQLAELAAIVAEQGKILDAIRAVFTGGGGGANDVATDAELDSEKGDPTLRFNPRDWKGVPRKGWQMSRCESECLEIYAEQLEYFAQKNDEKGVKDGRGGPKSKWDRIDARRARGWVRRLRSGWKPAAGAAPKKDGWGRPIDSPPADTSERAFSGFEQKSSGAEAFEDPSGADSGDDEIPF